MSPEEVKETLKVKFNIDITNPTLLRLVRQGVVPTPTRGGGGPGGRWTDYPPETIPELYAGWVLIHGAYGDEITRKIFGGSPPKISPVGVSEIRDSCKATDFFVNHFVAECRAKLSKEGKSLDEQEDLCEKERQSVLDELRKKTSSDRGEVNDRILSCFEYIWRQEVEYARKKMSD